MSDLFSKAIVLTWLGIALCVVQAGIFSGLNLAVFSVSRLRLEVEAASGNRNALKVLRLRADSNLSLATILWGNVAANVLLTLLSESVIAGMGAFIFSTFIITVFGEIAPQAYFSRNAIRIAAWFVPVLDVYRLLLYPVAKPTATILNWWLGLEGILLFREEDFRTLMAKHVESAETGVGRVEARGALNFLDLDDVSVLEEGESIDPRSIIMVQTTNGSLMLPRAKIAPNEPFLQQLDASGKRWVIFVDQSGLPALVLDTDHFLRDVLFNKVRDGLEAYCHQPIVISNMSLHLGDVIGRLKVTSEHAAADVIDHDIILVWGEQKRIITGADLLGRLLRGIASRQTSSN